MVTDPNIYALKLSLALETEAATDSLDQFGEKVQELDQSVAKAAEAAIKGIDTVLTSLNISLSKSVAQVEEFKAQSADLYKGFATTSDINDGLSSTGEDICKNLKEIIEQLEERQEIDEKLQKSSEEMLERSDDFLKSTQNITAAIKEKNLAHTEQLNLLQHELETTGQLNEGFREQKEENKNILRVLGAVWAMIRRIGDTLAEATKMNEEFVTVNNRVYGSMRSLTSEVHMLGSEYGILRSEALEAYKSLINVKTPREELSRLAITVSRVNRLTGVGITNLAEYTKRLRGAGFSIEKTEYQLAKLTEMQRKYGISTDEMNKHVQDASISSAEMSLMFEDGGARFQELQLQFRGLAVALGRDSDAIISDLNSMVTDFDKWALASNQLGRPIESAQDYAESIANMGNKLSTMYRSMRAASPGVPARTLNLQLMAQAETMGITSLETAKFAMAWSEATEELRAAGRATDDFDTVYKAAMEKLPDDVKQTMEWSRTWGDFKDAMGAAWDVMWQFIAEGLIPLLTVLTKLINFSAWLISWVKWITDLGNNIPVLGWIITAIKGLIGGVLALGAGLLFLVGITGGIPVLMLGLGRGIRIALVQIGRGLASLGRAVLSAAPGLLALGAALLMAGGGAYLFAQGVAIIGAMDYGKIAVGLFGLTAAIIAIGFALVLMSTIAGAVMPLVLALGFAIFLIGAAAMMMGYGIKLAAEGINALRQPIIQRNSPPLWMLLPIVAYGITAVGIASWIAAPGIFFLSIAVGLLAIAVSMMYPLIMLLMPIFDKLSANKLGEFSDVIYESSYKLMISSFMLASAGFALIIAGGSLMAGSASLAAGFAALLVVVGGFVIGSFAISLASRAISRGTNALLSAVQPALEAAEVISYAARSLMRGSTVLISALQRIVLVGDHLNVAADRLEAAGPKLMKGAIVIAVASSGLMLAAYNLSITGAALLPAAFLIWTSVWWIASAFERFLNLTSRIGKMSEGVDALNRALWKLAEFPADKLFVNSIKAAGSLPILTALAIGLGGVGFLMSRAVPSFAEPVDRLAGTMDRFGVALDSANKQLQSPFVKNFKEFVSDLDIVTNDLTGVVNNLSGPADKLTTILQNLGDAIAGFDSVGVGLESNLQKLSVVLDEYAARLEGVSQRIEMAIESRAMPALLAAERAGITEAVRSEAVTQVEVMPPVETENKEQERTNSLLMEQNSILQNLLKSVAAVAVAGPTGEYTEIASLLRTYLPQMAVEARLAAELNEWGK